MPRVRVYSPHRAPRDVELTDREHDAIVTASRPVYIGTHRDRRAMQIGETIFEDILEAGHERARLAHRPGPPLEE